MRIEEAVVSMAACHEYSREQEIEATSTFGFRGLLQGLRVPAPAAAAPAGSGDEPYRLRLMLQEMIAAIIEMLTGENFRARPARITALPERPEKAAPSRMRVAEWQHRLVERIDERERTTFSCEGRVRTADGREIAFTLGLTMAREFRRTREVEERGQVVFRDPLVVNFSGRATELSDVRFDFDLDADGEAESLPTLAGGSGYLALDANADGTVNDGRELFGACSGDGFADLAQHDADGNGWIDEADPVFAALGVWFPDGRLQSLKETGVGALHLGSAWTPFALNDADNKARGQILRSGVYLNEDGSAGTLQQIDLALPPAPQPAADG